MFQALLKADCTLQRQGHLQRVLVKHMIVSALLSPGQLLRLFGYRFVGEFSVSSFAFPHCPALALRTFSRCR